MKRNERGITLIALVVTIVVLLILAAVSISMLTGENGIINQAQRAQDESVIADEKEAISLAYSNCKAENMIGLIGNVTDVQLQKELDKNGENTIVTIDGEDLRVEFNETKNVYTINQEGKIEKQEVLSPEEANKIVDVMASEYGILVETADGTVRFVKDIEQSKAGKFNELKLDGASIVTKNGIRKKENNCFIDNEGKVYTWGDNSKGQLGKGEGGGTYGEYSYNPTCISDISGNVLNGKNIVDIYMSHYGTTAVAIDNEGKVYTWGENGRGQLGNGTNVEYSNEPTCISDIPGNALNGRNIKKVYIYTITVIAVDDQGRIYTWGGAGLGDGVDLGYMEYRSDPLCISELEGNALKGKRVEDICIDNGTAVMARDDEGKIYTWGYNGDGRLGNGKSENSEVPICISNISGNALNGKNIIDIYDIGLVRDDEGKIYTWGPNYSGGLGNGTWEDSNVPVCISELEGNALNGKNIVEILGSVVAKDKEGRIYTWGANYSGELGNGTWENSNVPICISELEGNALNGKNIENIYLGYDAIIAEDDQGKIYAWGCNDYGNLGIGTHENVNEPICMSDLEDCALYNQEVNKIEISNSIYLYLVNNEKILYTYTYLPE